MTLGWWHIGRTCKFFAVARIDDKIKMIRVAGVKQMSGFRRQMKFRWRTWILSRRAVIRKLAGRRTIERRFVSPAGPRGGGRRNAPARTSNPTMQFIINPAKQPPAFKLIRGEAKTRQHDHENQAIPELQPPLDGFGDHCLGNIRTFNIQRRTLNFTNRARCKAT